MRAGKLIGPITYLMRQFVFKGRNFILAKSDKDATKSLGPVTATGKTNISKVREIIENDGRYTICDIAKAVGILLSRVHFILKPSWKVRKSVVGKYGKFLPDGFLIY